MMINEYDLWTLVETWRARKDGRFAAAADELHDFLVAQKNRPRTPPVFADGERERRRQATQ